MLIADKAYAHDATRVALRRRGIRHSARRLGRVLSRQPADPLTQLSSGTFVVWRLRKDLSSDALYHIPLSRAIQ
jgi:hypothetical protein